ncbi:mCG145095, partial [Mus musculus]
RSYGSSVGPDWKYSEQEPRPGCCSEICRRSLKKALLEWQPVPPSGKYLSLKPARDPGRTHDICQQPGHLGPETQDNCVENRSGMDHLILCMLDKGFRSNHFNLTNTITSHDIVLHKEILRSILTNTCAILHCSACLLPCLLWFLRQPSLESLPSTQCLRASP